MTFAGSVPGPSPSLGGARYADPGGARYADPGGARYADPGGARYADPGGARYADPGGARYAVVDVETTGLDPRVNRVIECAVVELDASGRTLDEWATLVAVPGDGELGAQFVHGITRAMLDGAPSFPELLPELLRRLAGRVLVGHVLAFDAGHLAAECRREGVVLPDLLVAGVCTRDLARSYLPPGRRTLEACCAATGVEIVGAHTALGDARAAGELLRWFIGAGHAPSWASRVEAAARATWPAVPEREAAPLLTRRAG